MATSLLLKPHVMHVFLPWPSLHKGSHWQLRNGEKPCPDRTSLHAHITSHLLKHMYVERDPNEFSWKNILLTSPKLKWIIRNGKLSFFLKPKKKKLFVSCNSPKKNRVGKSVRIFFFFCIIFLVKNVCFMHILRWLVVGRAEKTLG